MVPLGMMTTSGRLAFNQPSTARAIFGVALQAQLVDLAVGVDIFDLQGVLRIVHRHLLDGFHHLIGHAGKHRARGQERNRFNQRGSLLEHFCCA
jgi:hypothetical protein